VAAIVIPAVFPLVLSSTDPVCTTESARKLADRIVELREQMALLLGLPLDVAITQALNFGAGMLGTRNQNSQYVDNTHFLMLADEIMTASASPGFVIHRNHVAIANDLGLGGPLVNCRDQAAAFPINALVHYYWIYNGVTLGTLSSLAPPYPAPGPVLPPGYVLGAYAGAMLLDGAAVLVPANIRGRWTQFKAARLVGNNLVSGALQALSVASAVPANAEAVIAQITIKMAGGVPGGNQRLTVTLFDNLNDECGSASLAILSGVSAFNDATGVMEVPQYSQTIKVTVPAPSGAATISVDVKILAFRNSNLG
jgi:hypothetical protein